MGQIPHSSTPLLHLCPHDKCFRCCLPSLRSGLNWIWYVPTPYYNFAGNCNQHHTHIHIRSACAGTQTYSSCRMLWIWCWGCTAHHRWDKIASDWCGFALLFLPLPFWFWYKKTAVKCSIFTTVRFRFYSALGITIHSKCSKSGRKGQGIPRENRRKIKEG